MKQFDLQGNEYDCTIEIPLKKATYEDIQALNIDLQTKLFVKDKEIGKLVDELEEQESHIKEANAEIEKNINKENKNKSR